MSPENEHNQIPFPDKLVGWWDILVGLGQTALHLVGDQFRHESPSEHFTHPLERYDTYELWDGLSSAQRDANEWVEKMGFGDD